MATPSFSGHILGIAAPAWGHLKPLAALASKVVQERSDIVVTLLVLADFTTQVEKEIDRYFPEHSGGSPRSNIRVISMGGAGASPFARFSLILESFGPIYRKLANMEPVLCSTGKSYDTPLKPSLAIVDFFFPDFVLDIRKASESDSHVTILAWNSGNAGALLRLAGPEEYGGRGDMEAKARELATATGRDVAEIEIELLNPATGAVIKIPGAPPMFDYEFTPQEIQHELKDFQKKILNGSYRFLSLCDGMITTTSVKFEPEAHETMGQWLGETNRPYYVLGPLQPQGLQNATLADSTEQNDLGSSQNGKELLEFLDNKLQTNGANSLLYISWGTFFWPKGEYVWKLIDILLELKFPFILACASPVVTIPAEVSAKVKASGIGWLSPWAPQQLILAHPVTGWFLTHCGQNSVTEATSQGVPMIAWPVNADQPLNAARLSISLDVAFELLEVRMGHGLKPLCRGVTPKGTFDAVESEFRDVLTNAQGPVGDRKRQNVQRLRESMSGAWGEEGDAVKALRKLLNDNFP